MVRAIALSLLLAAGLAAGQPASKPVDHKMVKADVDKWMTELSNWGSWGAEDQLGTLNLITPAKRMVAIALVKEGMPVSLAQLSIQRRPRTTRVPWFTW
jgi:hypothetical protein